MACKRNPFDDMDYRSDEEMYVDDQNCQNCRFYCDWDDDEHNGCKLYDRPDYKQYPPTNWCCDWKSISRKQQW